MDDETFETPDLHIKLEEAQKRNAAIQLGEFIEEPLESIDSAHWRASCKTGDLSEDT